MRAIIWRNPCIDRLVQIEWNTLSVDLDAKFVLYAHPSISWQQGKTRLPRGPTPPAKLLFKNNTIAEAMERQILYLLYYITGLQRDAQQTLII